MIPIFYYGLGSPLVINHLLTGIEGNTFCQFDVAILCAVEYTGILFQMC